MGPNEGRQDLGAPRENKGENSIWQTLRTAVRVLNSLERSKDRPGGAVNMGSRERLQRY